MNRGNIKLWGDSSVLLQCHFLNVSLNILLCKTFSGGISMTNYLWNWNTTYYLENRRTKVVSKLLNLRSDFCFSQLFCPCFLRKERLKWILNFEGNNWSLERFLVYLFDSCEFVDSSKKLKIHSFCSRFMDKRRWYD